MAMDYEEGYDEEYLELMGGKKESIYSDEDRADLVENDEISVEEDAFMSGYDQFEEDREEASEDKKDESSDH